jgi:glycosyltransferase involved in cell wall biosynthesis
MMKETLFIIRPGNANYPDITAYRNYFQDQYCVLDGTLEDYAILDNKQDVILWCIMGFFPKRPEAKFVIHDYRSLSVGRFRTVKDKIKRYLNCQPDLRIFLNHQVKAQMNFQDDIPSCLLDMGVPEWIFDIEPDQQIHGTYCYIGEMSEERKFDQVIDSFLANRKPDETFVLVGEPEAAILEKYQRCEGVVFTGRVPQNKALSIVKACDYAVCYFPYHAPHCYQTPTKLLEYAALRMNIICNDSPSNLLTLKKLGISAHVTGRFIFDNEPLCQTNYKNFLLLKQLEWSFVIKNSGVELNLANYLYPTDLKMHDSA